MSIKRRDGKTVLMTNDLDLPAAELVQGYHDLWLAERTFRSMKSVLEIEPVYHRTPGRITSHVHLCVLAYLLTRLVENRTGESWGLTRERLNQISLTGLKTERATMLKTKELNADERSFLNRCGVDAPPRILRIALLNRLSWISSLRTSVVHAQFVSSLEALYLCTLAQFVCERTAERLPGTGFTEN